MSPCHGASCSYGFETVTNAETGEISGAYRKFIEGFAFIIFALGVSLNTGILTVLISAYPNLDHFDGFLMNLSFGELISSFGLAFVFFVEFTTSIAPIGDAGCRFLTWLDVTSVTITITALISAVYELHHLTFYNRSSTRSRRKFIFCIMCTWIIASLPGIPYMATAKMNDNNYCYITHWSHDAEVLYICFMLVAQVIVPLAILVFLFVRIFIALRAPRAGDTMLVDETNPGSEANFQRALLKRKVILVALISMFFFVAMIIVSFVELSLALNLNDVEESPVKYARIREGNSLLECIKVIFVPMLYIAYYDKLKNRFKSLCCCRQEAYNSITARYSVYQQTVQDTSTEPNTTTNRESRDMEEIYETERDDVAILDNSA